KLPQSPKTQNCYLALAAMRPDPPPSARRARTCHDAKRVWSVMTVTTPTKKLHGLPPGPVPADTQRVKESPGRAGAEGVPMRKSRGSISLDVVKLPQSPKAQNCYLAIAAMRPDPPRKAIPRHKSRHGADRDSSRWHRCAPTESLRPRQGSNVSVLRNQASCFVPT